MKKIVALIGSRRKHGNTVSFIQAILRDLPKEDYSIEYIFPQDFQIHSCIGCGSCFSTIECTIKDELPLLQKKILDSDLCIVASPVYVHYMTADLKIILDRCSWWVHTLRLQGKPIVVLSTCDCNGYRTVIEPLSEIMTFMGGNVIATANGSQIPNQLNNEQWLNSISDKISKRIKKYIELPPQSNKFLENNFSCMKQCMIWKDELLKAQKVRNREVDYWKESGMLRCESFSDYLSFLDKDGREIQLIGK